MTETPTNPPGADLVVSETTNAPGNDLVIVCTPDSHCPYCAHPVVPVTAEPALRIMSLEQKADKIAAGGSISMAQCGCPGCGMAVQIINEVVPVELGSLTCFCGGKEFRFSIRSLKPNRKEKPTEWNFDLDITCISCSKQRFIARILGFFKLKRIKVGATGVDLEMK